MSTKNNTFTSDIASSEELELVKDSKWLLDHDYIQVGDVKTGSAVYIKKSNESDILDFSKYKLHLFEFKEEVEFPSSSGVKSLEVIFTSTENKNEEFSHNLWTKVRD